MCLAWTDNSPADDLVDAYLNGFMPSMQITFSYGPKPNEDFLQYYGFVDTDNKHDAYKADLLSYVTQNFEVEPKRLEAVQRDATWLQALQQVPFHTPRRSLLDLQHRQIDACKGYADAVMLLPRPDCIHCSLVDSLLRCKRFSWW